MRALSPATLLAGGSSRSPTHLLSFPPHSTAPAVVAAFAVAQPTFVAAAPHTHSCHRLNFLHAPCPRHTNRPFHTESKTKMKSYGKRLKKRPPCSRPHPAPHMHTREYHTTRTSATNVHHHHPHPHTRTLKHTRKPSRAYPTPCTPHAHTHEHHHHHPRPQTPQSVTLEHA
jgi:hypothetical protein